MLDTYTGPPDMRPRGSEPSHSPRLRALFAVGIICVLLLMRLADIPALQTTRMAAFDLWQHLWPRATTSSQIAIVDVDDASLAEIGQWPWPRDILADLVDELKNRDVRAIGFAMVFAEPDRLSPPRVAERYANGAGDVLRGLPDNDWLFSGALSQVPTVLGLAVGSRAPTAEAPLPGRIAVLGASPVSAMPHYPGLLRNIPELEAVAAGHGLLMVVPERDGVVRRLPLLTVVEGRIQPNLALEMARVSRGQHSYLVRSREPTGGVAAISLGGVDIPTNTDGSVWLHFAKRDDSRYISAATLLDEGAGEGQETIPDLSGRIVLIGTSAAGLNDLLLTPTGEALPSVDVIAQGVSAILDDVYLSRPVAMAAVEMVMATLMAGILVIVGIWLTGKAVLASTLVLCLVFTGISVLFFLVQGSLFDPTFPSLMLAATGGYLLYAAYRREETWRRHQEIAYHEYNALMRQVAENLFDGVMVVDAAGLVRACNNAGLRMLRSEERRLLTSRFLDWTSLPFEGEGRSGSDHSRLSALVGASRPFGARLRRRDGTLLDAELAVTSIDPHGLECFIIVIRDVTEKKRAEREVLAVSNRLREAIDNIDQGFALWDKAGRLTAFNSQFRYLFRPCAEAIGPGLDAGAWATLISDLLVEPQRSVRLREMQDAFTQGGALEIQVATEQWILATFKKTDDVGTIALFNDVSDLKLREIALIEANQRIERQAMDVTRLADELDTARRKADEDRDRAEAANQAKSTFLATMSHELRTPLNAVLGFSEAILQGLLRPTDTLRLHDYVGAIHQSGQVLLSTINSILDIAKIEADDAEMTPTPIALDLAIQDQIKLLEPQIEKKKINIRILVPWDMPELYADPTLVDHIIGNLLSNAVKFTLNDGVITIHARYNPGKGVMITVEDTGIGIEPADIERALAPFGQIVSPTSRRYHGTGLGLPLVRRAAERMGGSLDLESRPGVGTTVTVRLPEAAVCGPRPARSAQAD